MAKLSKQELNKKIQAQNMIIIALAIVIFILIAVSGSAAWYIRTRSDSADIILSNPVNIYITEFKDLKDSAGNIIVDAQGNSRKEHSVKQDILEDYNTKVYPGDKIKLRLGMQLGTKEVEASPAYVRVKLEITYEKISEGVNQNLEYLASQNLLEYKDSPDTTIWEKVDFNLYKEDTTEEDYWFVLKSSNGTARIAQNMETFEFLDGYIALSKTEITNEHANCKFHIKYIVQAIQTANVPDPLAYPGYGPWWDFAKGDIENV